MEEEFKKGETTQTGPGAPLDEVVDPATKKVPEEAADELEHEQVRPSARMVAHEHEMSEHSIWPFVLAFGLFVAGIGFVSNLIISAVGAVIVMTAIVGWVWEHWVA